MKQDLQIGGNIGCNSDISVFQRWITSYQHDHCKNLTLSKLNALTAPEHVMFEISAYKHTDTDQSDPSVLLENDITFNERSHGARSVDHERV